MKRRTITQVGDSLYVSIPKKLVKKYKLKKGEKIAVTEQDFEPFFKERKRR